MIIQLPLELPPIRGRVIYAYSTAIVAAHRTNLIPWLCNHFTSIRFTDTQREDSLDLTHNYDELYPLIQSEHIATDLYKDAIEETIKRYIRHHTYVLARVNKFFIPNSPYYMKRNYNHGLLIYGYDERMQVFHILSYDEQCVLKRMSVSFGDLIRSIQQRDASPRCRTTLLRYKELEYAVDRSALIHSLVAYCKGEQMHDGDRVQVSGMKIYDVFMRSVQRFIDQKDGDLFSLTKNFHVLWDHKKCMIEKIKFLESAGNLDEALGLSAKYQQVAEKALNARNLCLKYKYAPNIRHIYKTRELLGELIAEEKAVLYEVLMRLRIDNPDLRSSESISIGQ